MNIKNQPQDRQQVLIDLYMQYLLNEITLGQLLAYLRKIYLACLRNNMRIWSV
ncbi:transcriptional regulator [Acinetobacter haemolyticus]|nr:transcriptional regulator [Acinetobacter haemolyticus]